MMCIGTDGAVERIALYCSTIGKTPILHIISRCTLLIAPSSFFQLYFTLYTRPFYHTAQTGQLSYTFVFFPLWSRLSAFAFGLSCLDDPEEGKQQQMFSLVLSYLITRDDYHILIGMF